MEFNNFLFMLSINIFIEKYRTVWLNKIYIVYSRYKTTERSGEKWSYMESGLIKEWSQDQQELTHNAPDTSDSPNRKTYVCMLSKE